MTDNDKATPNKWHDDLSASYAELKRKIEAHDDMLAALKAVAPLMIPGMNWTDETGELVKSMVRAAIAKAAP